MYGIVNKAIEELIIRDFGVEKWEIIKQKSGVDIDFFMSHESYDDDVTYQLAGAAAEELNVTIGGILISFGEFWVLNTGKEKYGALMKTGGDNLKEFLINLPLFHNRVMVIYPKLTPPEFRITNIEESSLFVHYISKRKGLQEFVRGLLQGLSKLYHVNTSIELLESRTEGKDHEIFKISW